MNTCFKYLDFVSPKVTLELQNIRRFSSKQGVILSLINITVISVIAVMFGSEIYEKKKPSVITASSFQNSSQIFLNDFNHAFAFSQDDGSLLYNPLDYFSFSVYKIEYTNEGFENKFTHTEAVKCEKRHFSKWFGKVADNEIEQKVMFPTYCFDYGDDEYFKNQYSDPVNTMNYVFIGLCNPSQRKCPDDLEKVVHGLYFSVVYLDNFINEADYEKPIQYYSSMLSYKIGLDRLLEIHLLISKFDFISDNGWILEDNQETRFLKKTDHLVNVSPKSRFFPNDLVWFSLESPKIKTKYYRSYMKIQDLFAKVGGLINACLIVTQIFFYHYLNFLYEIYLNRMVDETEVRKRNLVSLNSQPSIRRNVNISSSNVNINDKNNEEINLRNNKSIAPMISANIKKTIPMVPIHNSIHDKNAHRVSQVQVKEISSIIPRKNLDDINTDNCNEERYVSYFKMIKIYVCCDAKNKEKMEYNRKIRNEILDLKSYVKLLKVD